MQYRIKNYLRKIKAILLRGNRRIIGKQARFISKYGAVLSALWAISGFVIGVFWVTINSDKSLNELGDFFAGWFSPLAFAWFVYTVMMQRRELALSKDAYMAQTNEMKHMVEQGQIKVVNELCDQFERDKFDPAYHLFLKGETKVRNLYKILPDANICVSELNLPKGMLLDRTKKINGGYSILLIAAHPELYTAFMSISEEKRYTSFRVAPTITQAIENLKVLESRNTIFTEGLKKVADIKIIDLCLMMHPLGQKLTSFNHVKDMAEQIGRPKDMFFNGDK